MADKGTGKSKTVDLSSGTLAYTVTAESDSIGAPLKKVDLVAFL
jgi:hypothetical protein